MPSVPLISASIMSKKIAEGIDALVLDVKVGSGAFMPDQNSARELAKTLIRIGEDNGKTTIAYLTDMTHPLGKTVGNWFEIEECIECLKGGQSGPLMDLSHQLAGAMIYLSGKTNDIEQGIEISKKTLTNGSAWKKFLEITKSQGGDTSIWKCRENIQKQSIQRHFQQHQLVGWII